MAGELPFLLARSVKFGEIFDILRPNGLILGHFWSIWLLVLTVMIEALVTLKHVAEAVNSATYN